MSKSAIYLKKLGQRGKINIFCVDGKKVRDELDEEFTNFGQHYRYPCIPEFEFWLDKEAVPDERKFFIGRLLVEWKMQKDGASYEKANDVASEKEASERIKSGDPVRVKKGNGKVDRNALRCRLLGKTGEGLEIWLVFGRLVRSVFDVNFTEGGHGLVYQYVPKNEVWVDNDLGRAERPYIILHELFERKLMEEKKLPYPLAHKKASKIEWKARHDVKVLAEQLSLLGWK